MEKNSQSQQWEEELRGKTLTLFNNLLKTKALIQRDLEDQIAEELEIIKNTNMAQATTPQDRPEIKLSDVVKLLDAGFTRYKKDNKGEGSIQEKYGLSFSQVKELFSYDELKGLKTRSPKLKVINDLKVEGAVTAAPEAAVKSDDTFA